MGEDAKVRLEGGALLIVGHGSRDDRANAAFERLVDALRERVDGIHVERAYVELATPDLDTGIDAVVRLLGGVGEVTVVPAILSAAAHVKVDIANAVERARSRHRQVRLVLAKHLGDHPAVVSLLADRARDAIGEHNLAGAVLLFAARGSSDPSARDECASLAQRVAARAGFTRVEVAFMSVAAPSLADTLDACAARAETVVVLPHLLNDGVLNERLRGEWLPAARARWPHAALLLGAVMAPDGRLVQALLERALEARGVGPARADVTRFDDGAE